MRKTVCRFGRFVLTNVFLAISGRLNVEAERSSDEESKMIKKRIQDGDDDIDNDDNNRKRAIYGETKQ